MTVTVEDIQVELQRELTDEEKTLVQKKIEEYTERAEKINPTASESLKEEYVTAGVIQALHLSDDVSSFTDGRFSVTMRSPMDHPSIQRFRRALLRLQGIRIWRPRGRDGRDG
jgi:hypothetical protein